MAERTPQEVRITVSVGPEDHIIAQEEIFIFRHAERMTELGLLQAVQDAVQLAKVQP